MTPPACRSKSTVATFLADRYRIVARVSRHSLHAQDTPRPPIG